MGTQRFSAKPCLRSEEAHTHIGPKLGWLVVGHKGEKRRQIDLLNEVRRPLYLYLQRGGRDETSPYVFTSQRSPHLTE